jgi:hypothetical protein
MAFIKRATTAGREGKAYLWMAADYGQGMKRWHYVTTDTPAVVEVSGYFRDTELDGGIGNAAGGVTLGSMQPGDELWLFQVGSLSDARTIQDDIRSQLVDVSYHVVVASDGGGVDITPDLLSATVTYTS